MDLFSTRLVIFCLVSCFIISSCALSEPQHVKISVRYSRDTSDSYTTSVEIGQKYTLSQKYTWQSTVGRFNLVSYTVDNKAQVSIPRHADGNFTIDTPTDKDHSITFFAVRQFQVTSTFSNTTFSPRSPTGDNWFDENTDLRFSVPYVTKSDSQIREQLVGWSADNSDVNIIPRQESGLFRSTVIHVIENHVIVPQYKDQYFVNVISSFGRALGTGWYDSGAIANISVIPGDDTITRHVFLGWQGQVVGDANQYSVETLVDSPKVMVANWSVDHTYVSVISIIVIAVLVAFTIYKKRKNP
jgi:hypothetical protein